MNIQPAFTTIVDRPLKILVLAQTSGYSHFQLNVLLAELLAKRGHYVVSLLANKRVPSRKNYKIL